MNGAYVPILSTSTDQVEFRCSALSARTPLGIAVENASGQSSSLQTTVEEAAPAIFTVDGSQQGQALAIRPNSVEPAALPDFRFRAGPAVSGELVSAWANGIEWAPPRGGGWIWRGSPSRPMPCSFFRNGWCV